MNRENFPEKHRSVNFVHEDQLWKDRIYREEAAASAWPNKWILIKEEYLKQQEELLTIPEEESEYRWQYKDPIHQTRIKKPPTEKKMPEIRHPPYPETTAKMTGWLSSKPEFNLEKFGHDWKGKCSVHKQFKWPPEATA